MKAVFDIQDTLTLFQCIQVNRYWCRNAIVSLWKDALHREFSKENILIDSLIACMSDESKRELKEGGIDGFESLTTNKVPLFDYSSFIQIFNYDKTYTKIFLSLENSTMGKENQIIKRRERSVFIYKRLLQLVSTHSSMFKLSLKLIKDGNVYRHTTSVHPRPSEICNFLGGIFSKFELIEIADCTYSDHLEEIAKYNKQIEVNQLEIHLCYRTCNKGLASLINNITKVNLLKLEASTSREIFSSHKEIGDSIKNKAHLVRELEINFPETHLPLDIITKCENIQKLKIIFSQKNYLRFLIPLAKLNTLKDLKKLVNIHLVISRGSISEIEEGLMDFRKAKETFGDKKIKDPSIINFKYPEKGLDFFSSLESSLNKTECLELIMNKDLINISYVYFNPCNELEEMYVLSLKAEVEAAFNIATNEYINKIVSFTDRYLYSEFPTLINTIEGKKSIFEYATYILLLFSKSFLLNP